MKYKECIKKIGLKNVILYEMFYILEIILNLPYLMLRGIAIIYDDILEFIVFITKKQQNLLARIFGKTRIINLSKISKRIDDFRLKTIKELKKVGGEEEKMNKHKKVSKDDVLKMFYDLQTKFWEAGRFVDGLSVDFLADRMETSTYQIRKAYKQLAEEGYLKLEEVPIAFEEYDNGLYTESNPYLFCKVYVLTQKAKDKFKKNGDEDDEQSYKI